MGIDDRVGGLRPLGRLFSHLFYPLQRIVLLHLSKISSSVDDLRVDCDPRGGYVCWLLVIPKLNLAVMNPLSGLAGDLNRVGPCSGHSSRLSRRHLEGRGHQDVIQLYCRGLLSHGRRLVLHKGKGFGRHPRIWPGSRVHLELRVGRGAVYPWAPVRMPLGLGAVDLVE